MLDLGRMKRVSWVLSILFMSAACGDGKGSDTPTKLVGGDEGVADYPRVRKAAGLLVENCCTFPNSADLKMAVIQGIESPGYQIAGRGFDLEVSFGPYTSTAVEPIYEGRGGREVDGVRLARFRLRKDATPAYDAARHLWIAKVGGRKVGEVFHEGWGLRLAGNCTSVDACGSMFQLVNSIRF